MHTYFKFGLAQNPSISVWVSFARPGPAHSSKLYIIHNYRKQVTHKLPLILKSKKLYIHKMQLYITSNPLTYPLAYEKERNSIINPGYPIRELYESSYMFLSPAPASTP